MDGSRHDNPCGANAPTSGEANFHALFNAMTEGVAIHELVRNERGEAEDYRIIDANPAYSKQTGIDAAQARGALASALYGAEAAPCLEVYSQVAQSGVSTSFEAYFEPLRRHFKVSAFSMGQDTFGTVFEDITERKRAEKVLRENVENFKLLTERAPIPIAVSNRSGEVEFVNVQFTRVFGYSREDMPTMEQWWRRAYPDPQYRGEVMNLWQDSVTPKEGAGAIKPNEYRVTCKDGSVRVTEIFGARIGAKELVVFSDITDRKRVEEAVRADSERLEEEVVARTHELREAQEELIRKERLATLGQFAGSVGHELRNPLGVISNAIYFLQAVIENPDDRVRDYLEMIAREVRNSERIICDLLEISRNRPPEKRFLNIQELISGGVSRLDPSEGIEVHTEIPEDLPPVYVDLRQMTLVLANLTANAVQAMPDGGRLVLAGRQEGQNVLLDVIDTGIGMSQELAGKIFDPLVTTKPRGIGLGLTLSKRLAELNGTRLEVESEEGKGSRFTIVFTAQPQDNTPADK